MILTEGVLLLLVAVNLSPSMALSDVQAVSKANNDFSTKVYNQVQKPGENLIFSPSSLHTILSLLYLGAGGQTEQQMQTALALPGRDQTKSAFRVLMSNINTVKNVTLNIANKIYMRQGFNLNPQFKEEAVQDFYSETEQVDFSKNVAAAANINSWVEQHTNNKIKDLISPDNLGADTSLVLVNAIYFKGSWKDKFDEKNTKTEKFYVTPTQTVDVQMMHANRHYDYKTVPELDAAVLRMPYKNEDLSMVIVLPNKIDGLQSLEAKLKTYDISTLTDNMYDHEVELSLPRFKIETTLQLNEPLEKIGLSTIFSDAANFTQLSDERLKVSKVVQKAFIEVNEEGAEAAAATGIVIATFSFVRYETAKFRADHPFVFFLQHYNHKVDLILFNGKFSAI